MRFASTILFAVFSLSLFAQSKLREIPRLRGPVMDEVGVLTDDQVARLEKLIRDSQPATQMQVWIVKSLENEPIESLSIRAADKWKLGTAKKDNGIIILMAAQDRAVRIEVGQGLEGKIPDALAGRIIDGIMIPKFRDQRTYIGLRDAILAMGEIVAGHPIDSLIEKPRERKPNIFTLIVLALFFGGFFLFTLLPLLLRRPGSGIGRSSWTGGWGGGGFGGGGFGGGGGWSGGGGGFSGGGSSGRW